VVAELGHVIREEFRCGFVEDLAVFSWSGLYSGRLPIGISVNRRSCAATRINARDRTRLIEVDDRLATK
jgi:hypothetical protein